MCHKMIKDKKGRDIRLELDFGEPSVSAFSEDNQSLGKIIFKDEGDPNGSHKIAWAYLDWAGTDYLNCGIGTEIVVFFKEYMGCDVYASDNDGIRRDDGSHLTGDAPAWVDGLREKGIM